MPAFENRFRNREPPEPTCSLQRHIQQSQSFNPFSQESKQMIHEVGNIELCELLDMEPKRSAKYVYHTGTSASSTARAGTSCEKEQRRIRNSFNTQWISFLFLTIKKRRPHGHRYGKKPGDREYYIAIHSEEVQKENFLGIHDRFIRERKVPQEHD